MKSKTSIRTPAFTLLVMLVTTACVSAQGQPGHENERRRYKVIDLGTFGGSFSDALGINNRGWITGFAALPDGTTHAFLRRKGAKTDLGTLGGPTSTPSVFMVNSSVNQRGEIVGATETSFADPLGENFCGFGDSLTCLPFSWRDGVMNPLPTLGGNNGAAFQINNRGQAVGDAENTTHDATCVAPQILQFKPVLWEEGEVHELPTVSGDPDGIAFAINNRGQAVGVSSDCSLNPGHALLWQNGTVTDLGTLGGLALTPSDINDQGQVVGVAFVPGGPSVEAFLWQNGSVRGLGTLSGDVQSSGNGINEKGQIVGQSCDANNNCCGFIWQRGVMTDLNTLIPSSSSLQLFDALDINSSGEIVGAAIQKSSGEFRAFLAIPCDRDDSDEKGCEDGAESATATVQNNPEFMQASPPGETNPVRVRFGRNHLWERERQQPR